MCNCPACLRGYYSGCYNYRGYFYPELKVKIKKNKMKTKTIFVSENEVEETNHYSTQGECISDNDDIFSDDDIVIEYQEVRRFKVSKPKIGLQEIKSKK